MQKQKFLLVNNLKKRKKQLKKLEIIKIKIKINF